MKSSLWLAASIFLFPAGLAAFIWLFFLDFNVFWLILSPIILALYEAPAVYCFWQYKRRRSREREGKNAPDGI